MATTLTKMFIVFGVIFPFAVLLCTQGSAQSLATLYQTKGSAAQGLVEEDEEVLNSLTAARYLLMSGDKLKAISKIKSLTDKLANKKGSRKYDAAGLTLLRIEEGRRPVYLYFPASFDTALDKDNAHIYPSLELFQGAKREEVVASLDMNYAAINAALGKAFSASMKADLGKADEYLQELYVGMIDDVSLANDPIEKAKVQLKEVEKLLKQGNVAQAVVLINESEGLLTAHIKANPASPYMARLQMVIQGYDEIRAFNYGKVNEIASIRDKIFYVVSDMRSKLKYIEIKFEL
jgi:hypothetical protein